MTKPRIILNVNFPPAVGTNISLYDMCYDKLMSEYFDKTRTTGGMTIANGMTAGDLAGNLSSDYSYNGEYNIWTQGNQVIIESNNQCSNFSLMGNSTNGAITVADSLLQTAVVEEPVIKPVQPATPATTTATTTSTPPIIEKITETVKNTVTEVKNTINDSGIAPATLSSPNPKPKKKYFSWLLIAVAIVTTIVIINKNNPKK